MPEAARFSGENQDFSQAKLAKIWIRGHILFVEKTQVAVASFFFQTPPVGLAGGGLRKSSGCPITVGIVEPMRHGWRRPAATPRKCAKPKAGKGRPMTNQSRARPSFRLRTNFRTQ